MSAPTSPAPLRRWPLWILLPSLSFGTFAAVLMTWHHETQAYGGPEQQSELIGCTESATVSCDVVNTSAWSELAGVPLATLAVPAYGALMMLAVAVLRGRRAALAPLLAGGIGATLLSGFLLWISLGELGYVCSWCLRMYAVNVSVLVLAALAGRPVAPDVRTLGFGAGAFTVLLLASVAAQRGYRAHLLGGRTELALPGAAHGLTRDPDGNAPPLSVPVTTEDGRKVDVAIGPGDAWKGNPGAKVVIVEFGDFECGYCKRAGAQLARLYEAYQDRVLVVFKHFPMDPACNPGVNNRRHPRACLAARAAVCAREQRRFWPFHDLAYKNQHQLGAENLRYYAEQAGVELAAYDACVGSPASLAAVRADGEAGKLLGIKGTPRIFINGELYRAGHSAEAMARAVELALGADAAAAGKQAQLFREQAEVVAEIPADVPAARAVALGELAFRIDSFEAALEEGKAVSGKHRIPARRMSWYAARDACAASGKRLCTEQEWVSACQNAPAIDDDHDGQFADDMIEGTAYPYGDFHDKGRCWDGKEGDTFRPVYTGERPGCASAAGVYDLTGNVEEWVGETPEKAVLLGGAWDTSDDHARCYRRNDTFGPGYANARTGFRCCSR